MNYATRIIDMYSSLINIPAEIIISKEGGREGSYKALLVGRDMDNKITFKAAWGKTVEIAVGNLHKGMLNACQTYIEKDCKDIIEA